MQIFTNANYNFIRWRWQAIVLSLVVILAGLGLAATRGVPMGIDFSGGTLVIVQLDRDGGEQLVRDAVASLPGDEVVQLYVRDVLASLARPVMELQGFQRITLAPGESRDVTFTVGPEQLKMLDEKMEWRCVLHFSLKDAA